MYWRVSANYRRLNPKTNIAEATSRFLVLYAKEASLVKKELEKQVKVDKPLSKPVYKVMGPYNTHKEAANA